MKTRDANHYPGKETPAPTWKEIGHPYGARGGAESYEELLLKAHPDMGGYTQVGRCPNGTWAVSVDEDRWAKSLYVAAVRRAAQQQRNATDYLELCPFCGFTAEVEAHPPVFPKLPSVEQGFRVACSGDSCQAMTCLWHSEAAAQAAWNNRTP